LRALWYASEGFDRGTDLLISGLHADRLVVLVVVCLEC